MTDLPFSQSCENNKKAILEVLSRVFADRREVLEIASGTAQHASWFATHLPQLAWQPSDLPGNLAITVPRCEAYAGDNLRPPFSLDVSVRPWDLAVLPDAVFTANSLHIMPWTSVVDLFSELGERANSDTLLAVYGPFNYGGEYTSPSNAQFDQWLARQNPHSAIRDFERVNQLAEQSHFEMLEDNAMPANNRLIVWRSGRR